MSQNNEQRNDKALSTLGLAARSRNAVSGGFASEEAIKSGKAHLVIIAADASDNTRKKYRNMCEFYKVPYHLYGTKDELGRAVGKEERSVVAVKDAGLADSIRKHLEDSE